MNATLEVHSRIFRHTRRMLVYSGGWLVAADVLLQRWRVTLVGFEDADRADLKVTDPDRDNIVWVGKTCGNRSTRDSRFDALSKRRPEMPQETCETADSGMG